MSEDSNVMASVCLEFSDCGASVVVKNPYCPCHVPYHPVPLDTSGTG